MNLEIQKPASTPDDSSNPLPWTLLDNWIGVAILVLINAGMLALALLGYGARIAQNAWIILVEMVYLLPVIIIFAWKRINWKHLGFGRFEWKTLGLGCGLLIGGYILILLHNFILLILKIDTQGSEIFKIFDKLESPVWFFLVGIVFAPIVEEIFFRGFLFQGFRRKYGWVNAVLLSSAIFAAAHLDPVAFIPTFILGAVMAYVYHRSNSVWPGIILHSLVNAFGLCAVYSAAQLQKFIPL